MLNKGLILSLCFFFPLLAFASSEVDLPLQKVSVDIKNKERLQRGAKWYMNYCSGCHSLKYMRYNRLAKDLGLTTFDGELDKDLLKSNLIFTQASIYDPIQIAMPAEDAKQWFGMVPPDLSLVARARGADWLFTYLQSFYRDSKRPFGSNNLLISDVAMPNVLAPLIGKTILITHPKDHSTYLQLVQPGEMYPNQVDDALTDLVTFLVYVGEPAQLIRYKLGFFVILFLLVFLVVAYLLKKVYWQRIKH
ncbi:MAG: cytochrome c1 [Legionella sp.]|nr:MAG: cytochrome c1 [Legionella sp.]